MKKLFLIMFCILLLSGCQFDKETMYIKPVELPEEESILLNMIGCNIYEYNMDDSIRMVTIKGVRYVKGEEAQTLINHHIYIDKVSNKRDYKLLFQLSDSMKYFSIVHFCNDYNSFGEKVLENINSTWNKKSTLTKKTSITAGIAIPIIVMIADEDAPLYDLSYYKENSDVINEYADIFIITITFDMKWEPMG